MGKFLDPDPNSLFLPKIGSPPENKGSYRRDRAGLPKKPGEKIGKIAGFASSFGETYG
jgi:hypothetical protein